MASTIDPTAINQNIPVNGAPMDADPIRGNFAAIRAQLAAAKADIETLEAAIGDIPAGTDGADGEDGADGINANVTVVNHGATASTARPDFPTVIWIGSVEPTNAIEGDVRFTTGA